MARGRDAKRVSRGVERPPESARKGGQGQSEKGRQTGRGGVRTLEDDQEQAEVAKREERLLPCRVEQACERRAVDDADCDLSEQASVQAGEGEAT